MVSPLKTDAGVFGILVADKRLGDIRGFDDEDRRLFDTLASHASAWLRNSQMAIEREHEALHDALTDLPNRRLLLERTSEAIERTLDEGTSGAMLLIDLDHFKDINDTWGHTSGDQLLEIVAGRLVNAVPADATVARLGGDEFAILLPNVSSPADAIDRAHDVRTVLDVPVQLNDVAVHVEASTGVALFPAHGAEATTILQRADVAMYVAKNDRTGISLYAPERDNHSAHRLSLLGELRDAIATGQMVLRFQPKLNMRTGQVTGVEALVRWQHPVHGII
jgi:diguanylate cyclase (GGDEF)-like protein